jgi:uncharacterized protein YjiS (DUF1127 family)
MKPDPFPLKSSRNLISRHSHLSDLDFMETAMLEPHAKNPWADICELSRLKCEVRSVAERGRDLARSLASRPAAMAGRWASGYAVWREHRRAVRELAAFDDRMLKDIGVNRSEIETVVYGQDATRLRDATIAASRRQRRVTA